MRFGFPQIVNLFGVCLLICILQLARLTLFSHEYKTQLSAREMNQDLYALLKEIKLHSAFAALDEHKVNIIENKLEPFLYRVDGPIDTHDFYAEIVQLLVTLDDPGLSITSPTKPLSVLPFTLRPLSDTWLALDNEGVPIDPEHPFITHIDGIPLTRWELLSQSFISAPLKHSISERVHWLSQIALLRRSIGMVSQSEVLLSLSDNMDSSVRLALPLIESRAAYQTSVFDKEISKHAVNTGQSSQYIEITNLSNYDNNKALKAELETGIKQAVTIIDISHAAERSDQLLQFIARNYADPEPINHDAASHLIALGQYRRSPHFKSDFLRPLGFIPYDEFNFFEQVEFTQTSQSIPNAKEKPFGLWYGRRTPIAQESKQTETENNNLLGVIIGPQCRRECEWLAYYAKSLSRVTLIGEKTTGDIGRHYGFTLPNSGISVQLTASLTYDMQGQLLSSVGITPDIPLPINEELELQGLISLITTEFRQPNLYAETPTKKKMKARGLASQSQVEVLNSKAKVSFEKSPNVASR